MNIPWVLKRYQALRAESEALRAESGASRFEIVGLDLCRAGALTGCTVGKNSGQLELADWR
jgi:hypothetical protein